MLLACFSRSLASNILNLSVRGHSVTTRAVLFIELVDDNKIRVNPVLCYRMTDIAKVHFFDHLFAILDRLMCKALTLTLTLTLTVQSSAKYVFDVDESRVLIDTTEGYQSLFMPKQIRRLHVNSCH